MKAVIYRAFSHKEAKQHYVQKPKQQQKKSKGLSAKQRRDMKLFDINPEQQRYSLFLPLHELWKHYIRDLCNGLKPDIHCQYQEIELPMFCYTLSSMRASAPQEQDTGHLIQCPAQAPTSAHSLLRMLTSLRQSQNPSVPPMSGSQESFCRRPSMSSRSSPKKTT